MGRGRGGRVHRTLAAGRVRLQRRRGSRPDHRPPVPRPLRPRARIQHRDPTRPRAGSEGTTHPFVHLCAGTLEGGFHQATEAWAGFLHLCGCPTTSPSGSPGTTSSSGRGAARRAARAGAPADLIDVPPGLAGVAVTATSVGDVLGDDGLYHYRGRSAVDLATSCCFEEVAALVLDGIRAAQRPSALRTRWGPRREPRPAQRHQRARRLAWPAPLVDLDPAQRRADAVRGDQRAADARGVRPPPEAVAPRRTSATSPGTSGRSPGPTTRSSPRRQRPTASSRSTTASTPRRSRRG